MERLIFLFVTCVLSIQVNAAPDWSENTTYPIEGRANPYGWDRSEFQKYNRAGRLHALDYPVEVTGILLPYEKLKAFVDQEDKGLVRKILRRFLNIVLDVENFDGVQAWLGLHKYPEHEGEGAYYIPFPEGHKDKRMGLSLINRKGVTGFTFSCVACHSGQLFGQPVIGMTNRFPRANEFFVKGKKGMNLVGPYSFQNMVGANREEREMYKASRKNVGAVGAKEPAMLGLDTSMAHIALSMARRSEDEFASKDRRFERRPRKDLLENFVADSKPAPWWNVKYKNRWFLDGSLVSGNPIITSIIWNEIGRGVDLKVLEKWLKDNQKTIEELTTAVVGTEAPQFTDFFTPSQEDLELAKWGEKIFLNECSKCHGKYVKAWSQDGGDELSVVEQFKTLKVEYHSQTPIKDVGTDPQRRQGSIMQINGLRVLKTFGIRTESQTGYIPPPLVGIWARWPYLHNNSIPNLCALLTPEEERPMSYFMGAPLNKERDFDYDCNGYPMGEEVPESWRKPEFEYKVGGPGLSNKGHNKGVRLPQEDKQALIRFLQTL